MRLKDAHEKYGMRFYKVKVPYVAGKMSFLSEKKKNREINIIHHFPQSCNYYCRIYLGLITKLGELQEGSNISNILIT